MVILSALPEVVARVFNNLAYSVLTFEVGPSSSESKILTVRTLMPFLFLTLMLRVKSPGRLAMGERKRDTSIALA